MATMASVDLGASSGRIIAGTLADGRFELREVTRFSNAPITVPTLEGPRRHWDILRLWGELVAGLRAAEVAAGPLTSIGIDTWAVDYGLLGATGALIGNPASYRCDRTLGAPERFFQSLPADQLFARTGLQVQPFNTVLQLSVEPPDRLAAAASLLLIPDLLGYWLTGRAVTEVSNASTTGLLDPRTRLWRQDVVDVLESDFSRPLLPILTDLVEPGTRIGEVNSPELTLLGPDGEATPLIAVGSHDTASAVVAVPAEGEDFAYISCGTWSLVGLELPEPVLTEAAREANLTNELGVDGTVRFLKNVMGLWVFNEALRTWREAGHDVSVAELVAAAAEAPPLAVLVDIDDPAFFSPGDMPARIREAARRTGQAVPDSPGLVVRCILDSLALAYRRAIRQAAAIADHAVSVVHIVGGGAQNRLLCQLTADATGLPVVAGPVEATALGNLVVQARACGLLEGGLADLREVVRRSSKMEGFEPATGSDAVWAAAERRLFG